VTVIEPTIRAFALNGLCDFSEAHKLDAETLVKTAGLDPGAQYGIEDTISLNAFARVLNGASEMLGDPCLGLKMAYAFPPGASGILGQLLLRAPTVRDAMHSLKDFAPILINPIYAGYDEDEAGQASLSWSFHEGFTEPRVQVVDFASALMVLRLRQSSTQNWIPAAFEFEHRELPCKELVTELFGNRIKYNSERNRLVVPAAALTIPIKSGDPTLHATLKHYAKQDLQKTTEPADFASRASKIVLQKITGGTVTLDALAEALGMSPRAVQWQLSQAGTTFEKLVSETRRKKAEPLLTDTDVPLSEIASAVGFSELSSFSRAASGWFGMSPRAYRQKFRPAPGKAKAAKTPELDGD
jgi:AraC-like DNA-binding protein